MAPARPTDRRTPPVLGIPCRLTVPAARRVLREVLEQIRDRRPSDWERILRVVTEIAPLQPDQTTDGTCGEWVPYQVVARMDDPSTWDYGTPDEIYAERPGVLSVDQDLEVADLRGVFAHELGHACTVGADIAARGEVDDPEWLSEAAADWYAYRWGFGRAIARIRRWRNERRHGPPPGKQAPIDTGDGRAEVWRLTRNFRFRQVK